jgi:molybdenum cofactor biosynthesis enzyme MoaA
MCTTIRPEDRKIRQVLLTKKEIIGMVDKLSNPPYIAITGGEPTLINDLPEIIGYMRKKFPKTEIKLLTNGRRMYYQDYVRQLVDSGVNTFIIPLHAHHRDLHDFIARTKGSFDQTVQAIKNLEPYNSKVEIRIVVHGINYPFLPEIAELINREFKNVSVVFLYFDTIGSALVNRNRLIVPMLKVVPHLERAVDLLKKDASIYHFPLCVLHENYRNLAKGTTVIEKRITFAKQCSSCRMKKDCCGIWKTYSRFVGTKEFEPIK